MEADPTTLTHRIVDGVALTECRTHLADGHRNPIVMVHGGCHAGWQWANLQTWFAEHGWNTTAIDWFSHGNSKRLDRKTWLGRDIPAVRHEIEIACAAAAEADPGAPIVIGHSMGGLATLAYVATTARDLAAFVLFTPVVPRAFGGADVELEVDFEQPWGPPPPDVARHLFYSHADDATAAAFYEQLQPESPTAVWQATRWTAEVDVTAISTPALVVAAEDDVLVPPAYVRALSDALGAEHILLPGVGHGVTLDPGWPELCARVEAWLSELVAASATTAD